MKREALFHRYSLRHSVGAPLICLLLTRRTADSLLLVERGLTSKWIPCNVPITELSQPDTVEIIIGKLKHQFQLFKLKLLNGIRTWLIVAVFLLFFETNAGIQAFCSFTISCSSIYIYIFSIIKFPARLKLICALCSVLIRNC